MSDSSITHPGVNPETRAYWEAAAAGRLLIKQCRACGKPHFYPRAQCPHCRSHDTEWKDASGRGSIYSYTVARRANPVTAVAYVTLDEGVTVFTNLVDCDFDALEIGQRVKVAFSTGDDGLTRPVFTTE
jgi:uncharacterized OB-fold protein